MTLNFLILFIGFILLIKGADWLVHGSSLLAKKYHVSDLAIGLTIVAFGTSAPELVVNVVAAFENHQEIVFGNVLGSNLFNLFAILGISGIITPLAVKSSTVWKEIPVSLFAMMLVFILANDVLIFGSEESIFNRLDGSIMLVFFLLFLIYVFTQLKRDDRVETAPKKEYSILKLVGYILFGFVGLIYGGKLVVDYATEIAIGFGVSERIIGLTIIAIGTSLPELVTSIVAARKNNIDLAVGNIIGSNIFNLFFILGASALVKPILFDPSFNITIYLIMGGTIILFIAMFTGIKQKLDRWEAILLFTVFITYFSYLFFFEV